MLGMPPARAILALVFVLALPSSAQIVVTTTVDEDDGDALPGNGAGTSLREAVTYATSGTTITFDAALSNSTLNLTAGTLVPTVDLSLDGSSLAKACTISSTNRVFNIPVGVTFEATLVIFQGGTVVQEGTMLNDGTVTLDRCNFAASSANEDIIASGTVINNGTMTLNQCTFWGNFYGVGSCLYNAPGGLCHVTSCTVESNAGFFSFNPQVRNEGTLNLTNSIVGRASNNLGGLINTGTLNESGVNLIDAPSASGLEPYGDYGGQIGTQPPRVTSPAIDPVGGDTNSPFASDQIGNRRVVGTVDSGAVEFQGATVTTANDEDNGSPAPTDGAGTSLREALNFASDNATIFFDPGLAGSPFNLTLGALTVNAEVFLDGSQLDGGLAIDAGGISRVFEITPDGGGTFTNLLLSNGVGGDGGGIFNEGTLTLDRCVLTGHSAGRGGGIFNTGSLTLAQTLVAGNEAGEGGGTYNDTSGTLDIVSATIASNTATTEGGGLFDAGTLHLANSIVGGNTAPSQADLSGSIESSSGVNFTSGDPQLGALDDYDGPLPSMPPRTGSPVIDPVGGDATSAFTTDLRGLTRINNGILDIGATELTPPVVTSPLHDGGDGSLGTVYLRTADSSTITFASSLAGTDLSLAAELQLTKDMTFDASALASPVTVVAAPASRHFYQVGDTDTTFKGLTLTGGNPGGDGGAIYAESAGTLRLEDCTLWANTGVRGGAINTQAALIMDRCTFENNQATDGGALLIQSPGLLANDCSFLDNTASSDGGAIRFNAVGGTFAVSACYFRGNSALAGGVIYSLLADFTFNNCLFEKNSTSGVASILSGTTGGNFRNCTIVENTAAGFGGVIDNEIGLFVRLYDCIVANNVPNNNVSGFVSYTGANLVGGDPQLAPTGQYGGITPSRPPLPGSPAIDPGGAYSLPPLTVDQHGEPREVGSRVDFGAVEYQGASDLVPFWLTDWDGDGKPFGLEFALGSDWFTPDTVAFTTLAPTTGKGVRFPVNATAEATTTWIVKRSLDLVSPFTEVYRYHGPTMTETAAPFISASLVAGILTVQDNSDEASAYYLVEAVVGE